MLCLSLHASPASAWSLARTKHFEVYSQAGDARARSALSWLEQLHTFFQQQTGLDLDNCLPVRVIAFRSTKEYEPFRLRPSSDAYYVGTESRDYIVIPALDAREFAVAAHEYAHLILHASGLRLPPWLSEGLAEFFSTIRISDGRWEVGGDLPARSQLLRRDSWMPLPQLLTLPDKSPLRERRDTSALFYAQSWKLTEMLVLSPEYGPRFHALLAALTGGIPGPQAMADVYRKPLDEIERELHTWTAVRQRVTGAPTPGTLMATTAVEFSTISPSASQCLMAELLLAIGDLDRARSVYQDLARESPLNPDISAGLGTIALLKGDRDSARSEWKQAIDKGIRDATLCYRYAILAQDASLSADEIRPALERAIALRPDFDDARYSLALLESNAAHYETAVANLRAMRNVTPARAYAYWSAMAYALGELGRRDESTAAAQRALEYAASPTERAHAAQLAYVAQTDLTVQFTRDASGHAQIVTTRVPHNTTDWNPFIEPSDKIFRITAKLRELHCTDSRATGIDIDTAEGRLTLKIPDPSHVLMRNSPSEFICGPQPANPVMVEYAASETPGTGSEGVLRGMEFR